MHFSIVTPSFGQINWLRFCVASIKDQITEENYTFQDIQVDHIIQDAGSDDIEQFAIQTGADFWRDGELVLKGLSGDTVGHSNSYKLRIFQEKDKGMYDAINRGFKRARGEWFAYLNSDEQYMPGALTKLASIANKTSADILFGDTIITNKNGKPLSYRRVVSPPCPLHTRLIHLGVNSCSMFFRKKVWESCRFKDDWRMIADAVFVEEVLNKGFKTKGLKFPIAIFTLTGANLGFSKNAQNEAHVWARSIKASLLTKIWVTLIHRVRKFLHGAYRFRRVNLQNYTIKSPTIRQKQASTILGWGWPEE